MIGYGKETVRLWSTLTGMAPQHMDRPKKICAMASIHASPFPSA
jgi:hypothetical protein